VQVRADSSSLRGLEHTLGSDPCKTDWSSLMAFPSDLEIARAARLTPLTEVGAAMGLGL